jgi:hypothetical protein
MKTFKIALSVLIMTSTSIGFAQDGADDTHTVTITVPTVALVDIEPAASKNLTILFVAPTEAGEALTDPDDDTTLWLNYSSIKSGAATTNTVSVKLDALLPGVDINVTAGADAGGGDGDVGTPAGAALTLTTADQVIVSAIGSSYTGDGATNGHNLTYSVDGATTGGTAAYADLVAAAGSAVTVTYTISNN